MHTLVPPHSIANYKLTSHTNQTTIKSSLISHQTHETQKHTTALKARQGKGSAKKERMSLPIDSILPPVPPRPSFSSTCQLHPDETFTGFCASCLRERLTGLESSTCAPGRKSTSALKSLFPKLPSASSSFRRPSLRRCKSFSYRRGADNNGDPFEPQRHSCDVRGRNTLWALFHQDDRERVQDGGAECNVFPLASSSSAAMEVVSGEIFPERSGSLVFSRTSVAEENEEEEEASDDGDEIRPVVEPVLIYGTSGEIEESVPLPVREERDSNMMPMKEHIDIESQPKRQQTKDLKEIAGSFWLAASVFSKKWQKWRRKQKMKKQPSTKNENHLNPLYSKPSFLGLKRRKSRESEFMSGENLGRRSCDTDPRFSLDVGRMSVDDPSFSWDEPRASWDGCLIGGTRSVLSRPLPMLSVLEDTPTPAVPRSDGLIPVEEDCNVGTGPGSFVQARDYYRRSFERSNSMRRPSFSLEMNENKPMNVDGTKISSPAGGSEFYHFLDREFVGPNSLKDDNMSYSFDSSFRDSRKANTNPAKKARKWGRAWSILSFIHRKGNKLEGNNIQERSFSEINGAKIMRSNSRSSVSSSRSSFSGNGSFGSSRRTGGLERNRSGRFSPGRVDNGMLRFYLTPRRNNSRRNGMNGKAKNGINSHLFARSAVGIY